MKYRRLFNLTFVTFLVVLLAPALDAHPVPKRESRSAGQEVTPHQIQQAVLNYVKLHEDEAVVDVQVNLLEPEQSVMLPSGRLGIAITPIHSPDASSHRQFDVGLSINGKYVKAQRVLADIVKFGDVAVTTRLIKMDETIQPDDVTLMRTPLTVAVDQYARSVDEVIGKRAGRPLAPRIPINPSTLAQPYVVRKGDRVTIEAKRKGLVIQTIGITKAVGQVGQMVTVTNQDSGKDLRARVVGSGLVQVEF